MFREIAQILLAIQLSHSLPPIVATSYAHTIDQQASTSGVDPLIFVSIIEHESQFNPRAVSLDKLDIGLMQIRLANYAAPSNWLFNPENNIKVGAYIIKKDIEYCRRVLKREPTTQEWLSAYQGSGFKCKPTKLTKLFEDHMLCLQKAVELPNPYDMQLECKRVFNPNLAR